jgi:hypothetical protein
MMCSIIFAAAPAKLALACRKQAYPLPSSQFTADRPNQQVD